MIMATLLYARQQRNTEHIVLYGELAVFSRRIRDLGVWGRQACVSCLVGLLGASACVMNQSMEWQDRLVDMCVGRMKTMNASDVCEVVRGIIASSAQFAAWEIRNERLVGRFCDQEFRIPEGCMDRVERRLIDIGNDGSLLLASGDYIDCYADDAGLITNNDVIRVIGEARLLQEDALNVEIERDVASHLCSQVTMAFSGVLRTNEFYKYVSSDEVALPELVWLMSALLRGSGVCLPFADIVHRGYHHGTASALEIVWLAFQQRIGMGWRLLGDLGGDRGFMKRAMVAAYLVAKSRCNGW